MSNEKESRYPWADAPGNAVFAVTEDTGRAWWYCMDINSLGRWSLTTIKISGFFDPSDWQNSLEINPKFTNQAPQLSPDFTEWNAQMLGEMTSMVAEQVQARANDALYREHLRAQFAGQIMAAYRSQDPHTHTPETVAHWAVMDADALIAALYPSPKNESAQ